MSWNLADVWEAVAEVLGEREAQRQAGRSISWSAFDRRANALAADLLEAGLGRQAKVAVYLYNCPEYLESYFACFKAALVPVNVNYRYGAAELAYLISNADAEAVVFHACFAPLLEEVRGSLPLVRRWYAVADGSPLPRWAREYEAVVGPGAPQPSPGWGRSGDDLLLLYTGGTTGMPKGVMWRQEDLFKVLGAGGNPALGIPPVESLEELRSRLRLSTADGAAGIRFLPACPLMHGTGQFTAFVAMNGGACVVTMPDRSFDPERLWDTVEAERVNAIAIVGDAFARPMLAALEANPGRWDLSSLLLITSSGVMWSQEVKEGLLRHLPQVLLFDSLGSSEAVGLGASLSSMGEADPTARFKLGEGAKVVREDGSEVEPGSGEVGYIALPGYVPVGYYKDPAKSAATFRTIDGRRYSVPGDMATVDADGTIRLLGRGSVVINTGGEKVFPEEVEEVVKTLSGVADAVCVGVPDERFGERVCALVERAPGATLTAEAVQEVVRARLAGYKVPRMVHFVPTIGRSPAGKVDYPALRRLATEAAQAALQI